MSGATKGGGVLDRHGLHENASWPPPSLPLSYTLAAVAAAAGDKLDPVDRGNGISALEPPLADEASSRSGGCVNGAAAAAAAAAISAAS